MTIIPPPSRWLELPGRDVVFCDWEGSPNSMWCAHCESEVAAEASPETGEIRCASCGNEIASGKFERLDQNLRSAKELLDRWSREPLLEPYGPRPGVRRAGAEALSTPTAATESSPTEPAKSTEPQYRVDPPQQFAPHDPDEIPETDAIEPVEMDSIAATTAATTGSAAPAKDTAPPSAPPTESGLPPITSTRLSSPPVKWSTRMDRQHPPLERNPPHLNIQSLIEEKEAAKREPVRNGFMVMAGQWLSYLGILGLTAGASLVVYGYFGDQPGLTPKGWMLTTAGQMLLFLGIVTLISGGMEQATDEMSRRIQILGDQMHRFEKHTREQLLRGPKLPVEGYAEGDREAEDAESVERKRTESRT